RARWRNHSRKNSSMSVPRLQQNRRFGPVAAPSGHKGLKKGVYLVPSLFTTMNILAGFYSLMATMSGFRLLGIGGAQQISDAESRQKEFRRSADSRRRLHDRRDCSLCSDADQICAPSRGIARDLDDGSGGLSQHSHGQYDAVHEL